MPRRATLSLLCAATCLAGPMVLAGGASGQNLSDRIAAVARQRQAAASRDNSQANLLGALLYADVSVDFDETPAREAFDYL